MKNLSEKKNCELVVCCCCALNMTIYSLVFLILMSCEIATLWNEQKKSDAGAKVVCFYCSHLSFFVCADTQYTLIII